MLVWFSFLATWILSFIQCFWSGAVGSATSKIDETNGLTERQTGELFWRSLHTLQQNVAFCQIIFVNIKARRQNVWFAKLCIVREWPYVSSVALGVLGGRHAQLMRRRLAKRELLSDWQPKHVAVLTGRRLISWACLPPKTPGAMLLRATIYAKFTQPVQQFIR